MQRSPDKYQTAEWAEDPNPRVDTVTRSTQALPRGQMHKVLRRIFAAASGITVALIAVFHLQLLWERLVNLSSLEPEVAIRWLLTMVVVAALVGLWKRGISLIWGRPALVLWILILLIHVQGPIGGPLDVTDPNQPLPTDQLLLILPVSISIAVVGRVVFGSRTSYSISDPEGLRRWRLAGLSSTPARVPLAGFFNSLSPRAPPA